MNLVNNQLTSLSEHIGNLTSLSGLGLTNNQLPSLPESLSDLTNLSWLGLANNQLTSLPSRFGNLTSLSEMDLYDNLLPIGYQDILNALGLGVTIDYTGQAQLMLKAGLNPYVITKGRGYQSIDYA